MSYFINAKQARLNARVNSVIHTEITALETLIFAAIDNNEFSITANTTTMTTPGTTAEAYYVTWQGTSPNANYTDQMTQVIDYFEGLGYSIYQQTNTSTSNTFVWVISW
jgi:hypothetical protein